MQFDLDSINQHSYKEFSKQDMKNKHQKVMFQKEREKYDSGMKHMIYGITNMSSFVTINPDLKYQGKNPIDAYDKNFGLASKNQKKTLMEDTSLFNVFGIGV